MRALLVGVGLKNPRRETLKRQSSIRAAAALVAALLASPLTGQAERPPRVGAAGWCGEETCDQGISASLHGWRCKVLFRGGWCGLSLLAGRETGGAGVYGELTDEAVPATALPFLPDASGQAMRVYLGLGAVGEYSDTGRELAPVLFLRVTLEPNEPGAGAPTTGGEP